MPVRKTEYIESRNAMIRKLYEKLRSQGKTARYAMMTIQKELRGELSYDRIRRIIYSKEVPPVRHQEDEM